MSAAGILQPMSINNISDPMAMTAIKNKNKNKNKKKGKGKGKNNDKKSTENNKPNSQQKSQQTNTAKQEPRKCYWCGMTNHRHFECRTRGNGKWEKKQCNRCKGYGHPPEVCSTPK